MHRILRENFPAGIDMRDVRENKYYRRRGNRRNPKNRESREQSPICPVCSKPVRNLYSAITHEPSNQPAHFDCILKDIRDNHELHTKEKVCYLGGGSFGIIQIRNTSSAVPFLIRKRIQYETTEPIPEWRKNLTTRASYR